MYVLPPRKLRVGDRSGAFTLIAKSEYKSDIGGYHLTWSSANGGIQIEYISAFDFIGIDSLARV